MKTKLIFAFVLFISIPVTGWPLQGNLPTVSMYIALSEPGFNRPLLIEVNQALLPGNENQIHEALLVLKCVTDEFITNLRTSDGKPPVFLNRNNYPIGLRQKQFDNRSQNWRKSPFCLVDWRDLGRSARRLNEFLLQESEVENILEKPNVDIRFFLSTDPNYTPYYSKYTVVPYRGEEAVATPKAGFKDIKKKNKGCEFNYSPSSRIWKALDALR